MTVEAPEESVVVLPDSAYDLLALILVEGAERLERLEAVR